MKGFNRIIAAALIIMAAVIVILDAVMLKSEKLSQPLYKVEVSRIERELSQGRRSAPRTTRTSRGYTAMTEAQTFTAPTANTL